jgi:nuclear pore complex protein Nup210
LFLLYTGKSCLNFIIIFALTQASDIKIKEAFRQPSAGIHVVTPGYLGFQVLPGRKWVLEVGRVYEIYIEIYDKDSHKIFPSEVSSPSLTPEDHVESKKLH